MATKQKTTKQIEKKRQEEKNTIAVMVKIYCHGNHNTKKNNLCCECQTLIEYSQKRSEHCRFMATKTFCAFCSSRCYSPQMTEHISKVMKYAGPRMLFVRPIKAIKHVLLMLREKKRIKKETSK